MHLPGPVASYSEVYAKADGKGGLQVTTERPTVGEGGDMYLDGSMLPGLYEEAVRAAWAIVMLDIATLEPRAAIRGPVSGDWPQAGPAGERAGRVDYCVLECER